MKLKKISQGSFKYELEADFTIRPRFDQDYWRKVSYRNERVIISEGFITFRAGCRSNGLTHHKDHLAYLVAAMAHDVLLDEGYTVKLFDGIPREYKDRVFLSVMLDGANSRWDRVKAYWHYYPVRLNSKIQEWFGG